MILFLYITRPTNRFLVLFSCGIGMRTGTQIFEKKTKQNVTRTKGTLTVGFSLKLDLIFRSRTGTKIRILFEEPDPDSWFHLCVELELRKLQFNF